LETAGNSGVHLNGLKRPDSDDVVGITSEQGKSIGRPGQRDAVWYSGWLSVFVISDLDLELFYEFFLFEVPDSDGWSASGAQPVSVWTEDEGGDFVTAFQAVKWVVGGFAEIPKHGFSVLSTGSSQGSIWGDGDGVDVTGVAGEVVFKAKVGQVPDFQGFVPRAGNDDWVLGGWGELDGGNPLGVARFTFLTPFELTQSVPEFDGLVSAGGDDLSVVGGESNGEYVVLVSGKPGGGDTSFEVPKSEGLVPRGGNGELTAAADNNIADKVIVALQSFHWVSVGFTVSVQLPDDQGLVSGRRDEHIWELWVGGDLGNPATVAFEGSGQGHDFLASHFFCFWFFSVSVSST